MKTHELVEHILKYNQSARNSDKELMIEYLQSTGAYLSEYQKAVIRKGASLETLTRVRRKLQEGGKYPATDKVTKERQFKSMQMQQISPKAKPEYMVDTIQQRLI